MSSSNCRLCKRDISKPALVRCREASCPLKAVPKRAPLTMLVGLGGGGMLVAGAMAFILWQSAGPGGASAPGEVVENAFVATTSAPDNVGNADGGGGVISAAAPASPSGWLNKLFTPPKPKDDEAPAFSAADEAALNARAPSRVQNFSCSGTLSASRSQICSNWTLAITDYNVALEYRDVLARSAKPHQLRKAYAVWLARLNELGADPVAILKHYNDWRARLDTEQPATASPLG